MIFLSKWKHFIDCIQHIKPVGCTLEDGMHALQLALAAVKSASTGQRVNVAEAPRYIMPMGSDLPSQL